MKVGKFLKSFFFAAVTIVMAVGFASCSEDDELATYTYSASGNLTSVSSDLSESFGVAFGIAAYNEAIKETFGDNCFLGEKDKEVIFVCDIVYKGHKAIYESWKGVVEIKKVKTNFAGEEVSTEIIKTYKYGE